MLELDDSTPAEMILTVIQHHDVVAVFPGRGEDTLRRTLTLQHNEQPVIEAMILLVTEPISRLGEDALQAGSSGAGRRWFFRFLQGEWQIGTQYGRRDWKLSEVDELVQ